jgi:hypothetical protein
MRILFNSLGIVFLTLLAFFLVKDCWWQAIISFFVAAYFFSLAMKKSHD